MFLSSTGGQFDPVWDGQFESVRMVSLNRSEVVKFIGFSIWEEYRQRMISHGGIAVFIFGNKLDKGGIVNANGVIREFEIAVEQGLIPLPIALTGYATQIIYEEIRKAPNKYYKDHHWIIPLLEKLASDQKPEEIIKQIIDIIKTINK